MLPTIFLLSLLVYIGIENRGNIASNLISSLTLCLLLNFEESVEIVALDFVRGRAIYNNTFMSNHPHPRFYREYGQNQIPTIHYTNRHSCDSMTFSENQGYIEFYKYPRRTPTLKGDFALAYTLYVLYTLMMDHVVLPICKYPAIIQHLSNYIGPGHSTFSYIYTTL